MASKCQDSGTQILQPVSNGTAWCGCCGQTVQAEAEVIDRSNSITVYAAHNA